ncbi:MAG: hypothetical protein ACI4QU_00135 [Christensenellales bacterium]
MKRKFSIIVCVALCVILALALCACGTNNDSTKPESGTIDNGGNSTGGEETGGTVDNDDPLPTAAQVVEARQVVANSNEQNYDFSVNLSGTLNYGGYSGTANANYDGKYRYNKTTGDFSFYRATSGILLVDSQEYIYTEGDAKIKINANESGKIKKVSVVSTDAEGLNLINIPFVKLIDSLQAKHLVNICLNGEGGNYKYKATLQLEAEFMPLQYLFDSLKKYETDIELGGVSFTNPNNGVIVYFNMANGKLSDFTFSASLNVPVSGNMVEFKLTYEQKLNNTAVINPSIKDFKLGSDCQSDITLINNAIASLRDDDVYSLDVSAINDFDPGWNVTAVVDKFLSRVYKNTIVNDGLPFVCFNDTYEYVAHTEEEGKETYKYTIGNIQDGSVYIVSRKGTNTVTPLEDVDVNTRFDYLTAPFILNVDEVDCLSKSVANGVTTYQIGIKDSYAISIQEKILEMVNSNDIVGVIKAQNYFNNELYNIINANLTVVMEGGKLVSITIDTEIKYCPTGGEYTESNVTLKNTLELLVNDKLSKAQDYTSPSSTGSVVGLSSASKAIR